MKKDVLGVKIDDISIDQALETVQGWLSKPGKQYVSPKAKGKVLAKRGFYIVTPNPEFLISANEDQEFKNVLNKADLAIPDGVGLKLAGVKNTVAGIDLMERLIELSGKKGYTIGLLGGKSRVAEKAAERLKGQYHNISIVFAGEGGQIDRDGNVIPRSDSEMRILVKEESRSPRPFGFTQGPRNDKDIDILFVAFGHVKQEKWIVKNLPSIPVKVAMGVGGAFDYLSGKVPRAPAWIRSLGLEWLFRLIIEPWRVKRQLSLLKFIWLMLH